MTRPRSERAGLTAPDAFFWATGIEDTFVFDPHHRTGRALDEYALTGHYDHWRDDLRRVAELGVPVARYGIPWYKASPAKGKWDWGFADDALGRLLDLGVEPVVDLVHYGTPGWLEGSFLDPDFPRAMAEFAATLAQRYRGRIRWYTPLNEPRITAWYCGKLGHWPPYARGWTGFLRVLVAVCKGIVLTDRALDIVDPEIVRCHVDATDLYDAADPGAAADAEFRQHLVFLALDLVTGRVDEGHPLHDWLLRHGVLQLDLDWFRAHPLELDLLGINLYPMFSHKIGFSDGRRVRYRMRYDGRPELVERLGRLYWERYRVPLWISETASAGSVRRRREWLDASVEGCRRLRVAGIPMVGYTWWPMFSLVAWSYRGSDRPLQNYFVPMGLWDLDADLERRETPLVAEYQAHVRGGAPGRLAPLAEGGA